MTLYPDPSLHIAAGGPTFLIVAGNPVAPAIIMAGHPDPLPDARDPFPCYFPMTRNIFRLIPAIVWFRVRGRRRRIVNNERRSMRMDLMGNDAPYCKSS
jgi:hypothetical protein